jgi:hypothetical protein
MRSRPWAVLAGVVAIVGCRGSAEPAKEPSSSSPAPSHAPVSCEAFFAHINKLTKTPSVPPGNNLAYCEKHTDEQRRCTLAATTVDAFNLCSQFADTSRRDLARVIQDAVKQKLPGTVELHAVITKQRGCAFVGVVGAPGFVLDEARAVVTHATRGIVDDGAGIVNINSTFVNVGSDWRCEKTDPPDLCDVVARSCRL